MLKALCHFFSWLPLSVIHGIGVVTGFCLHLFSEKFSRRTRQNIASTAIVSSPGESRRLARASALETGKGLIETFAIWFRKRSSVLKLVRGCQGWEHVEAAIASKHGIIFLTPHLGCYEIAALYYAARHPITVLYRPARKDWLETLIAEGRDRDNIKQAPTNMRGIRSLLLALRKGEAIGILPDQVPEAGEGVWAEFFGKPAYTMSLVGRLAESTQAQVLLAFGERLPWGRGYLIHIQPFTAAPTPQNINDAIEQLVRRYPQQYLWSYRRFKNP